MKKSMVSNLLLSSLLMIGAGRAWAVTGDPAAGQTKNAMCAGCHGISDYRTAYPDVYHVPKLGGQHAAYIVKALQEYKAGERPFATMHAIASSLSDQDMADLAAYYEKAPTR